MATKSESLQKQVAESKTGKILIDLAEAYREIQELEEAVINHPQDKTWTVSL